MHIITHRNITIKRRVNLRTCIIQSTQEGFLFFSGERLVGDWHRVGSLRESQSLRRGVRENHGNFFMCSMLDICVFVHIYIRSIIRATFGPKIVCGRLTEYTWLAVYYIYTAPSYTQCYPSLCPLCFNYPPYLPLS